MQLQVTAFETAVDEVLRAGIDPGLRHLSASGGLLSGAPAPTDLGCALGLAMYGVPPDPSASTIPPRLRSRRSRCSPSPAGSPMSPSAPAWDTAGTWVATRPSRIATLPMGYADGWGPRRPAADAGLARREAGAGGRSDLLGLDDRRHHRRRRAVARPAVRAGPERTATNAITADGCRRVAGHDLVGGGGAPQTLSSSPAAAVPARWRDRRHPSVGQGRRRLGAGPRWSVSPAFRRGIGLPQGWG